MWAHDLTIHSKKPNFLVKARITYTTAITLDEFYTKLNEMRIKLEKTIPGTYKAKFTVGIDGLIIMLTAKNMGESHRVIYMMEDFIKSAIITIKS